MIQSPVRPEIQGSVGADRGVEATTSANASRIGSIIAEWKACEVASRRAATSPSAKRASNRSIAAVSPETTVRLGAFSAAISRSSGRSSRTSSPARPDRQHCSFGQGLHESGAFGDEPQRVIAREYTSQTRGHVLADGVADHAFGLDPEPAPRHRKGVLDDEEGGLGYRRLSEPLLRQLFAARLGIEHVA